MPNKKSIKTTSKKAPAKKVAAKKAPAKKIQTKSVKSVKKVSAPVVKQQKVVSFGRAFANFFRGYFDFEGTAQRSEFWWMLLVWFGPAIILTIMTMIFFAQVPMAASLPVEMLVAASPVALWWCWTAYALWGLICIIPMWALVARRFHDIGMTAKFLWVVLAVMVLEVAFPFNLIFSSLSWCCTAAVWLFMLFPSKLVNNPYRK